jgi:hypothetical protein
MRPTHYTIVQHHTTLNGAPYYRVGTIDQDGKPKDTEIGFADLKKAEERTKLLAGRYNAQIMITSDEPAEYEVEITIPHTIKVRVTATTPADAIRLAQAEDVSLMDTTIGEASYEAHRAETRVLETA